MKSWLSIKPMKDSDIEYVEQAYREGRLETYGWPMVLAQAVKRVQALKEYIRENRIDRTAARILRYEYTAMNDGLRLSDRELVVEALRTAAGCFRQDAGLPMGTLERRQEWQAKARECDALADRIEGEESNEQAEV